MNQILKMIMRIFLRKVISKGMDKGFEMASSRKKKGDDRNTYGVSEVDRTEMKAMRQNQKRAKQATKISKRMTRF